MMSSESVSFKTSSDRDLALVWTADAAHRFAVRTALAPRPLHQWSCLHLAGRGFASQLNRWPRAVREGIGGTAYRCPPMCRWRSAPAHPPSGVPSSREYAASRWQYALSTCRFQAVVYTNFASVVEDYTR